MTLPLQQVIDSLRHELQQYGEMLALLETQGQCVAQQETTSVLTSNTTIEVQSAAIETARLRRETAQRQLAWAVGLPKSESFQTLLPLLPDNYRPLVGALVCEINELIGRVIERANHNHRQLQESVELMAQFVVAISNQSQSALLNKPQDSTTASAITPLSAIA